MIIKNIIKENGRVEAVPMRESWTEYIVFEVRGTYLDEMVGRFPNYRPVLEIGPRYVFNFWHKSLYPFVLFVRFVTSRWFRLGHFFLRRNMLKVIEGQRKSWFWPIYFFYQQKEYKRRRTFKEYLDKKS